MTIYLNSFIKYEYTILGDTMFNRFLKFLTFFAGLRLLCFIGSLILIIIILYQMLITLFIPCFSNVLILLIEYLVLLSLIWYVVFCF